MLLTEERHLIHTATDTIHFFHLGASRLLRVCRLIRTQLLQSSLLYHPAANFKLWEEGQMKRRGNEHKTLLLEKDTRY